MLLDVYENPPLHISSGADYKLETKFAIKTKRKRRTWLHNLYRKAQVVIWSLLRWFDIELQNRKSTIPSRNEVTSKQASFDCAVVAVHFVTFIQIVREQLFSLLVRVETDKETAS